MTHSRFTWSAKQMRTFCMVHCVISTMVIICSSEHIHALHLVPSLVESFEFETMEIESCSSERRRIAVAEKFVFFSHVFEDNIKIIIQLCVHKRSSTDVDNCASQKEMGKRKPLTLFRSLDVYLTENGFCLWFSIFNEKILWYFSCWNGDIEWINGASLVKFLLFVIKLYVWMFSSFEFFFCFIHLWCLSVKIIGVYIDCTFKVVLTKTQKCID